MSFSLRVAIADDDPSIRESLRQMLCDLGHEVVAAAENGESLISQCAKANPDVVITGTLTPRLYGSDAAAAIYKNRPIPIILYSCHCEPDLVRNAEHKHVFMYLVKPICPEDLQTALEKCRCAVRTSRKARRQQYPMAWRHPGLSAIFLIANTVAPRVDRHAAKAGPRS